jgi:hypothetical protein
MWVRQGRTDPWIAHKLDVSVDELARFKREHALDADEEVTRARPADPLSVPVPEPSSMAPEEPEEDDELEDDDEEAPVRERPRSRSRSRRRPRRPVPGDDDEGADDEAEEALIPAEVATEKADERDDADGAPRRRRRRGRRGGRRHRARRNAYEATFDHGGEGYGLWLDPAVADNPVYSEHWAGHRAVTVTVEAEAITIRRAEAGDSEPEEDSGDDE